ESTSPEIFTPFAMISPFLAPLLLSILSIVLITAALFAVPIDVATMLVPLAYLVPVVFAATRWGIWPAMLA
ncbi:hypothetical protein, partial [Klebsiella variicola]